MGRWRKRWWEAADKGKEIKKKSSGMKKKQEM